MIPKGTVGSNPTFSASLESQQHRSLIVRTILPHGEVPKLAEGTPLERVQVVNSGARVQIPPSPFLRFYDAGLLASRQTIALADRCKKK